MIADCGLRIADCGISWMNPKSEIRNPKFCWRKFSGNSLRAKRTHFLYHGTLLYDFDLALIETLPENAAAAARLSRRRPHRDFVTNLPLSRQQLTEALEHGLAYDRRANRLSHVASGESGRESIRPR